MALSKQELQALAEMVIAGGKSPATGGDGFMIAAQLITVLQREIKALEIKAVDQTPAEQGAS